MEVAPAASRCRLGGPPAGLDGLPCVASADGVIAVGYYTFRVVRAVVHHADEPARSITVGSKSYLRDTHSALLSEGAVRGGGLRSISA
jgi:hypothetical protein